MADTRRCQDEGEPLSAVRSTEADAKGLAAPSDPTRCTSVRDPGEPFLFSFPTSQGRIVSNTASGGRWSSSAPADADVHCPDEAGSQRTLSQVPPAGTRNRAPV